MHDVWQARPLGWKTGSKQTKKGPSLHNASFRSSWFENEQGHDPSFLRRPPNPTQCTLSFSSQHPSPRATAARTDARVLFCTALTHALHQLSEW